MPGHFTGFAAREGEHLITTHRGWRDLIASLDFVLRVALISQAVQVVPGFFHAHFDILRRVALGTRSRQDYGCALGAHSLSISV